MRFHTPLIGSTLPAVPDLTPNQFRNYHIALTSSGAPLEISGFAKYQERLLLGFDPAGRKLVNVEVVELADGESADDFLEGGMEKLERDLCYYRAITDPALVSVMEVGQDDGILYAVRECVSGETIGAYMRRVGRKLPVWNALDLALQMINVLNKANESGDLAERFDPARTILAPDFGGRLRLRVDGFILNRNLAPKSGDDCGSCVLVRKVCNFLHFVFCGHWVPVDHARRAAPMLGELPESVRYLIWAAFHKSAAQGAENLEELKKALRRIQDNEESRPLAAAFQPLCRLRQHMAGSSEIESLFGKKYRVDTASNPVSDEFLPTVHEQRLEQQPFGYSMRLHVLPGGKMIGESNYQHCIDRLDSPRNVSHKHVLRACDHAEKGDRFLIVEESINGFSLEELTVRRGGFDVRDAATVGKRVHEALSEMEESQRWMWDLSAVNVLIHFESRLSGAELLSSIDHPVAQWPSFKVVLRLHPTMSSLIRGVSIPGKIIDREESEESDAEFNEMRNSISHSSQSLAALLWKLLSFNPYSSSPMPYGRYRKLRRLTDEGNSLLELCIISNESSSDSRKSREELLAKIEDNMGILERPEATSKSAIALPISLSHGNFVPGGSDSRRLQEDVRDEARRKNRPLSLIERLKKLSPRAIKEIGVKKVAVHLSMAALISLLAVISFLFLNTSTRGQMVSFLGSVIDKALGGKSPSIEEPGANTLASSPVDTPAPKAEKLIPVVKSNKESIASSLIASGPATCVPPDETLEIAAIEKAQEEVALDETAFLPNPEKAVEVLDEILSATRRNSEEFRNDEGMLLRAARAGSMEALVMLGDLLKDSDTKRALLFYKRASQSGHPSGINAMADCHWNGIGMPQDRNGAVKEYSKAADLGNVQALEQLGILHMTGQIPAGSGSHSRLEILKMGAEKGSGRSAASLGVLYLNGLGVDKDPKLAAGYFEKSAHAGCADGMLYFARCLQSGIGISVNKTASSHWFQKAANAGNEVALKWCRQHEVVVGNQ